MNKPRLRLISIIEGDLSKMCDFVVLEEEALKIKEEYNYDWTDDEL